MKNCVKKKNIILIEDGSESLGAKIKKLRVGQFGDISMFSLRSEKLLGVGEGAIICTDNKKLFEKVLLLCSRNMPFRSNKNPYWMKYISNGEGYNYLMPHLLSSVLRGQIERHKEIFKEKIRVARLYKKIFKNYFNFAQIPPKNFHSIFWLNSIILEKLNVRQVQKVGEKLMKLGIEVRSGFWPLINTKNIKSIYVGKEKISQQSYNRIIVLPSNYKLKGKDILFIRNQLIKVIKSVMPNINFDK